MLHTGSQSLKFSSSSMEPVALNQTSSYSVKRQTLCHLAIAVPLSTELPCLKLQWRLLKTRQRSHLYRDLRFT